jgi:KaiC/GvpD/RAD55 family RecA-like ATPase
MLKKFLKRYLCNYWKEKKMVNRAATTSNKNSGKKPILGKPASSMPATTNASSKKPVVSPSVTAKAAPTKPRAVNRKPVATGGPDLALRSSAGNGLVPEIVPPLARVESGIVGFDKLCHGGLPEISTVMVSGASGTGKTMFATQVLFHAASLGKRVLYFTFSEPVYKVVNFASNLEFFNLQLIDNGKFKIIDLGPMSAKITEKNTAHEIIAQIVNVCKTFKPRIVAVDPVTMVGYLAKTELSIRQATLALGNALSELGITTILCSEAPLSESGYSRFGVEEYMADMIVYLRHEPFIKGKSTGMTMEIVKMRGSMHESGKNYYTITQKGISVVEGFK